MQVLNTPSYKAAALAIAYKGSVLRHSLQRSIHPGFPHFLQTGFCRKFIPEKQSWHRNILPGSFMILPQLMQCAGKSKSRKECHKISLILHPVIPAKAGIQNTGRACPSPTMFQSLSDHSGRRGQACLTRSVIYFGVRLGIAKECESSLFNL